ncbi:MAG: carboxypeptidase-like regulatory domain-containing protein, partial [Tannerellaceae bacterium]|nr:carboxypeptidase-like regulatory domain-containing protein [Tannerellaceae bacterium]
MTNFTSMRLIKRNLLWLTAGLMICYLSPSAAFGSVIELEKYQVRTKIQISGLITDSKGEPLAGALIREKESGNGTITDIDGNFTMSVSPDALIEISYFGYKAQEIVVGEKTSFRIVMEDDMLNLEEVVVVGYGVQRKINLSGSVDQISAKQLEARPISNLSKGLQ